MADPSFRGVIPFFEEIDEKPRKVDAMLTQLRLAGAFTDAPAVLLGDLTGCDQDPDAPTRPLAKVIDETIGALGIPLVSGLPFGHEKRMWTLPFGARLRVERKRGGPVTISLEGRYLA